MEIVASSDEESLAIVDYAHNELSFKTLFESVKNDYPGRKIIAVFGAPGGKAEERRECLPRVAAQYADFVIYTEEDPAHERVEDICAELAANTPSNLSYRGLVDREQAIGASFPNCRRSPSGRLASGERRRNKPTSRRPLCRSGKRPFYSKANSDELSLKASALLRGAPSRCRKNCSPF